MKKQAFNPYLPSWEYVPDGEPYVFDGRVYVYGSHDRFNGYVYCMNDYVCWSAPVEDLSDWRYEGVIYQKIDDPFNPDGSMCLYAPDVTKGPDGRYYLFYVLDKKAVFPLPFAIVLLGNIRFTGMCIMRTEPFWEKEKGMSPNLIPASLRKERLPIYIRILPCWG